MDLAHATIETVFVDAAGTLMHLTESVGSGYASIARQHDMRLDPTQVDAAFRSVWKRTPPPQYPPTSTFSDREAIDRHWWRRLVLQVLTETGIHVDHVDPYFDDLYLHYGTADAWTVYPGTRDSLAQLAARYRVFVFSNFDQRLVPVLRAMRLDGHLQGILHSTALGACKPDGRAFTAALDAANARAETTLHVGDDLTNDGQGATRSGLAFFHFQAPDHDLRALVKILNKRPD